MAAAAPPLGIAASTLLTVRVAGNAGLSAQSIRIESTTALVPRLPGYGPAITIAIGRIT
jgi:hypothetical protein